MKIIKENIVWIRQSVKKYVQETNGRRIVMYGYGIIGKEFYRKYYDRIDYIIDNFVEEEGVWRFDSFCEQHESLDLEKFIWVIASSNHYEEFYEQIKECYHNAFVISYKDYWKGETDEYRSL